MAFTSSGLYAPKSFLEAHDIVKAEICNGAGPKGYGWIVFDTMYGLSVTEAADIHDWMYYMGVDITDKEEADRVFLNNMNRIIETKTKWKWLRWLRKERAAKYYYAVKWFGGPAFWENKE